MKKRVMSWLLAGSLAVPALALAPAAAVASPEGRKNTALILGGAAIYSLAKKKTTQGLVLGAGSVYAYKRYRDAKSKKKVNKAYAAGYRAGRSRASIARNRR